VTTAVCDSGPLLALANRLDTDHRRVQEFFRASRLQFVVPTLCVGEVAYLLERDFGPQAEAAFIDSCRTLDLIQPSANELERIAELIRTYSDFPLGAVDASVVALAESLDTPFVVTLDHRHFRAIRPKHVEAFTLLPEL
jgi:predicted nucleic acid-binding protein